MAEFFAAITPAFFLSLIHVDTELGAKDLLSRRMAYVSISRGARDPQIFTNNAGTLARALSLDVSHAPTIQQIPPSQMIEQTLEQPLVREPEISHGLGIGM